MMGRSGRDQGQLFYSFNLEEVVPDDHLVRAIAGVLDLSWVRSELAPHYSALGRPSIDPVLMIRMLVVGYVFAIRSERALCREVRVNLAYRWFCGLGIEDKVPDHSVFSRARNERFRDHDIFRLVFERVVGACIAAGFVGGEGSRAIRQAEVGASQTMIERTQECFGIRPHWLVGDTAYGSAPNLDWLVNTQGIAPHIPVIDKSKREDGTFSREDFIYDEARDCYVCPAGKTLTTTGRIRDGDLLAYLASVYDCRYCPLKPNCCPKTPQRKVLRSIYEPARDVARTLAKTEAFAQSRRDRKKVEMLFAHLKRILRLSRLRLRGPSGAQFEFTLAAIAQNLRRLAKLVARPPPVAFVACHA
jgi:transposase